MIALIVDDSAAMRRIQKKALEEGGWQVEVAANGVEALQILRTLPTCNLLLTDWHMPEMDGLSLVRAVRQDQQFGALKIVMVTSDGVMTAIQAALEAGANDLVMKPFSATALRERVAEVMET